MLRKVFALPQDEHSSRFLLFAVMMLFIFLGDGVMSYYAPVVMEEILGSATKMGMIMAMSSIVGTLVDFIFARYFPSKKGFFFQRLLLFVVFMFPLSFMFGLNQFSFLFAMLWWGVSYEAMIFTAFHGVHEHVSRVNHAWAWGVISIFRNISLSFGALIASISYANSMTLPLFIAIILNALGVFVFFIRLIVKKKDDEFDSYVQLDHQTVSTHRSWSEQLAIWLTLDKKVWPLLIFLVLFYLCDSAVYTIGPLLGEKMQEIHAWGGLFVSMYSIPGIFLGFIVGKLSRPYGKKKLAFFSGIWAGLGFLAMVIFPHPFYTILLMFFSACWFSLLHPSVTAVFEDLIVRVETVANDLISITSVTSGIGYIVGPVINGMLADVYGERMVFALWGGVLMIYSLFLLFLFPRKIRMPQTKLAEIMGE